MVQDEEMRYAQEFLKASLEDTEVYENVEIGKKIEGIDNTQKKRHVVAERYDGKKFLGIVNVDIFTPDRDLRKKLGSTSQYEIPTLPILRKTKAKDEYETFFTWGEGVKRPSLKRRSKEERRKMIDTKKTERTIEELTDNYLVYFDSAKDALEIYELERGIIGDYTDDDRVPIESEELVKARIPREKKYMENFILGEEETSAGFLYAPPVSVDHIMSHLEEAERSIDEGDTNKASSKLVRAEFWSEEFPERLYQGKLEELYEKLQEAPGQQKGFDFS